MLRSLAEGCGIEDGAHSLSLGLLQQHNGSSMGNGMAAPRESMDGATPQYEQLQVHSSSLGTCRMHHTTLSCMLQLLRGTAKGPSCMQLEYQ